MAHISSEIQDVPPNDESTGSETSIRPLYDYTLSGDLVLRSLIEEYAFQALSEEVLMKRPRYTFFVSETGELNDFLPLTFPQKLWNIVESDQFQSIWWDESGTCIVINEELFKKEVLERKAPFRIFETNNMKSLVRQLNLYGFSKKRQPVQRSASLSDFLEEENNISLLSKLQIYYNPNFKREYPQLLVRIKRRVGIKNVSAISSLVRDCKKKHVKESVNIDDHNSDFLPETSGESTFSASTSLSVPFIEKPHTSQIVANTRALALCDLPSPSSISVSQTEQILGDQPAVLNQLSIFKWHSHSSYTQVNGHFEDLPTTTTSNSQNHILSPLQSSYSRLMVEPSKFPDRYSDMSAHDSPFRDLQKRGNSWPSVPKITYTSASSLSSQLIKNHRYVKTMLIKTDLSNKCQIMEPNED
ncbi:heat shock transcription factor, Y-linked-like [Moschus berezovskii]|uniref:heat shock transcription factor, Y-linked-like n=1 Tax=Moschus berezovskii TaxID=68408 RepID=UPI002443C6C3|nr:heat shock transcription factor, Y-linked-like [Moschus berezovskii]